MIRILTTAGLALGLTATTAFAQQAAESFEDFQTVFQDKGTYASMDADGDGMVSEEEFNRGVFNAYDEDGDGTLSEDEMSSMGEDRLFATDNVNAGGAATETQD